MSDTSQFHAVGGGGSLLLAWQLKDKRVLVIGGGKVAATRIVHLLGASALITIIAPLSGLCPEVLYRLRTPPSSSSITHIDRVFSPSDIEPSSTLDGATPQSTYSMVLSCIPSASTSSQIYILCKERNIPVNIADVPPECDFYFGSMWREGPVQVCVSTNGKGPRMANRIRGWIGECLEERTGGKGNLGMVVERIGRLRELLRERTEGRDEEGKKRMGWIIKVTDAYNMKELSQMDERDMRTLLDFYERGDVPDFKSLRNMQERFEDPFDGSFGFCVGFG